MSDKCGLCGGKLWRICSWSLAWMAVFVVIVTVLVVLVAVGS